MFTESQQFRQPWAWIILVFVCAVTLGSLLAMNTWLEPSHWLTILPIVLVMLLLYVWRLDTCIDVVGIHYRVFPVLRWRTIPWHDVQSVRVQEYSRFVGYGIRWSFDGWVYNVAGNQGLRIVFKDKHQITIGTQQPEALQHYLKTQKQVVQ